jgi:hypothetical protein
VNVSGFSDTSCQAGTGPIPFQILLVCLPLDTAWSGPVFPSRLLFTDLFYQIVDRFSPHVIAGVFFGHTHEDQLFIYYSNNGTTQDAAHAVNVGWMGKSD